MWPMNSPEPRPYAPRKLLLLAAAAVSNTGCSVVVGGCLAAVSMSAAGCGGRVIYDTQASGAGAGGAASGGVGASNSGGSTSSSTFLSTTTTVASGTANSTSASTAVSASSGLEPVNCDVYCAAASQCESPPSCCPGDCNTLDASPCTYEWAVLASCVALHVPTACQDVGCDPENYAFIACLKTTSIQLACK